MAAQVAGAGEAANVGQAMGDEVGQHGSLLMQGRSAQRGWRAVRTRVGRHQAFAGCPTPAREALRLDGAEPAGSAGAAEQVALHAAAAVAEPGFMAHVAATVGSGLDQARGRLVRGKLPARAWPTSWLTTFQIIASRAPSSKSGS